MKHYFDVAARTASQALRVIANELDDGRRHCKVDSLELTRDDASGNPYSIRVHYDGPIHPKDGLCMTCQTEQQQRTTRRCAPAQQATGV